MDCCWHEAPDGSPYIYLAEESSEPAFVSVGFAAESEVELNKVAAIDSVPIESNTLPGGGLIARLTDPNGFAVEVVANIADRPPLTEAGRSDFNDGVEKHRLGERVAFAVTRVSDQTSGPCGAYGQ